MRKRNKTILILIIALAILVLVFGCNRAGTQDSDQPQTEAQLLARIDHSLSQIETGEYADAEDVENELLAGLDE